VLNAANEVAVQAFIAGRIRFTEIAGLIEKALSRFSGADVSSLEAVLDVDAQARAMVKESIAP
jgi:1-deoxy-D-xylulose-5-phosphate reductoisomerase